jgi:hypothetical protein
MEPADMTDRGRSPWHSIRDSGIGFLISICVFGATAFGSSVLLKGRFFQGFFESDSYWRADSFAGLVGAIAWLCTISFLAQLSETPHK